MFISDRMKYKNKGEILIINRQCVTPGSQGTRHPLLCMYAHLSLSRNRMAMTVGTLSFSQHTHQMPWPRCKSKHWKGKKLVRQPLFTCVAHRVFRGWVPGPQEVTVTSSAVEHGTCAVGVLRRTRILLPWIRLFCLFFFFSVVTLQIWVLRTEYNSSN